MHKCTYRYVTTGPYICIYAWDSVWAVQAYKVAFISNSFALSKTPGKYRKIVDTGHSIIIIIIIHEFHRDASLEQSFGAAMCHVLVSK